MFVLRDCAISHQTDRGGWITEGPDLTLVFVGPIMTFDNVLQVGMVALNQCSEGIFGYIHALRDSLSQVVLLKKTYRCLITLYKPDAIDLTESFLQRNNRNSYFKAIILFVGRL